MAVAFGQRSRERGDTPGERCPVGPSASRDAGGTERLVREETSLPLEPSNRRDAGDEEDAAVRLKWGPPAAGSPSTYRRTVCSL
jgi:hypothetical protein